MSWVRAAAVVFLSTIIPGTGWGADIKLGLAGAMEYDSNVYRSSANTKDDVVFRITPKVRLIEDEGKFHWDLSYRVPWEKTISTSRVDGFSHFLNASSSYQVNGQTRLFFTDLFTRSDSVNRFRMVDEVGGDATLSSFRAPVTRNDATLGAQHSFTPRLMGNLAFSNRLFASDLPRRSDSMVYGSNANLVYAVSSLHRMGGGAAVTYQDFDESHDGSIAASQTLFFNVYATWTWTIDETTTFDLTGGPTYVDSNQDAPPVEASGLPLIPYEPDTGYVYYFSSCGLVNGYPVLSRCRVDPTTVLPESERGAPTPTPLSFLDDTGTGGSSSDWTFFGEAALNKRWSPRLLSTLTYRRTESTASGTGSATLDLVSLSTSWKISELWDGGLRADFTRRESTAPLQQTLIVVGDAAPLGYPDRAQSVGLTATTVKQSLATNRWGVAARMSRRLTKHIRASLRYSYNEQSSKTDTAGSSSDFSNHLVTLGVEYDFDRWHLW